MANTTSLVASTVMDTAASLQNDSNKTRYGYSVQYPYLNLALQELQEQYELNNVPVTDDVSVEVNIPAGTTEITFAPTPPIVDTPYLPDDLIEPKLLWQREYNVNSWLPMSRVDFLPYELEGVEIPQFYNYTWSSNKISFLPANQLNQIKMNYIRNLFTRITDPDDNIAVINAATFLEFRTGALLAKYIGEDEPRANELNGSAALAMDRALGIASKGRQRITIRRRPFRAAYKRRSYL